MSPFFAVVRTELRILRHDPGPLIVLIVMPILLMTLLSDALGSVLRGLGEDAPGSAQTTPGMACMFGFFSVAFVGFAIFREHGWRTWPRLRAAGVEGPALIGGKLAVPAVMLLLQHLVLFGFATAFLDFRVAGSAIAAILLALAFAAMVLSAGLAAAALLSTVQQLNAVTNVGAMALGGLGGVLVPVDALPDWVQPLSPISPVNWAMVGYHDVILDGAGLADVLPSVAGLSALAVALAGVAAWGLRSGKVKRTWG